MTSSAEVDQVFPRDVFNEIDSALRTMKDLPQNRRAQINGYVADLIKEKRSALAKIMDKPGNEAAYFIVGMLFVWESARISIAGTMQERMMSVTVQYKTDTGEMISSFASIAMYFFKRYKMSGGNEPGCLAIIKEFGV